jgi:hypothetical protein
MAELLDILDAFATPLKVGWVVWLAWGIGLVFWYRHDRDSATASKRPSAPVRKPFVSKPSMPQRRETRMITPEPAVEHQAPVVPEVEAPPPVAPSLLEPASALHDPDEVTDHVAELDRFVAAFEMNTRHRHATPPNEEQSSSDQAL